MSCLGLRRFIYQTVNTISSICPRLALPSYPFIKVWIANAALIPPEGYQRRSEISPLTASESFTQRRVQRINAGSPHSKCSVNGATVMSSAAHKQSSFSTSSNLINAARRQVVYLRNPVNHLWKCRVQCLVEGLDVATGWCCSSQGLNQWRDDSWGKTQRSLTK